MGMRLVPKAFDRARAFLKTQARPQSWRERVVARDPAAWASYTITPLKLVSSPGSLISALLEDVLPAYFAFVIQM